MMTKVINRHRQGRDSRDPEQSLEIGREQTEGCPTSNPQLGDRETEAPIAISASIPRENAGHNIVLLSLPSIAGPRLKE
jgi:hypothetical protein